MEREPGLSGDWDGIKLLLEKAWGNRTSSGEVPSASRRAGSLSLPIVRSAAVDTPDEAQGELVDSLTNNLVMIGRAPFNERFGSQSATDGLHPPGEEVSFFF